MREYSTFTVKHKRCEIIILINGRASKSWVERRGSRETFRPAVGSSQLCNKTAVGDNKVNKSPSELQIAIGGGGRNIEKRGRTFPRAGLIEQAGFVVVYF